MKQAPSDSTPSPRNVTALPGARAPQALPAAESPLPAAPETTPALVRQLLKPRTALLAIGVFYVLASSPTTHLSQAHDHPITEVTIGGGGEFFSTADERGGVRLWERQTHNRAWTVTQSGPAIRQMAFDAREHLFLTLDEQGVVRIYTVTRQRQLAEVPLGAERVAFSEDGRVIVAAVPERGLLLHLIEPDFRLRQYAEIPWSGGDFALSPDAAFLVTAEPNAQLKVYAKFGLNPPEERTVLSPDPEWKLAGGDAPLHSINFSNESHYLSAQSGIDEILIWEFIFNRQFTGRPESHIQSSRAILDYDFYKEDGLLGISSFGGYLGFWQCSTGDYLWSNLTPLGMLAKRGSLPAYDGKGSYAEHLRLNGIVRDMELDRQVLISGESSGLAVTSTGGGDAPLRGGFLF